MKLFPRKLLCLFYLIGSLNALYAQNLAAIDSLKKVLAGERGLGRFEITYQIVREYGNAGNTHQALEHVEMAEKIALHHGDTAKIVRASRARGQLTSRLGRSKESNRIFKTILPIAERHQFLSDLILIYNGLGSNNTFLGNYSEGLKYLLKSLELSEKSDDKFNISVCLHNIGVIYYKLYNDLKARDYYLRAIAIKKEIGDSYDLDMSFMNLGLCYSNLEQWDEAENSFKAGYRSCGNNCNSQINIMGEYGFARMYFLRNRFDEAVPRFLLALKLAAEEKNNRFQADNLLYLGRIELRKKNYLKAAQYLKQAEKIALQEGYKQILAEVYGDIAKLYQEQRVYSLATKFQQKYFTYRDSTVNENLANNLAVLHVEYEQKQNQILLEKNREILNTQSKQTVLVSAGAALLALLVVALVKIVHLKQEVNRKLDDTIEMRTRELESSQSALLRSSLEQNEFFYKAVKDIQAPIASIKGINNIILLDFKDQNIQPYINEIMTATDKLDELVTRLSMVKDQLTAVASNINFSTGEVREQAQRNLHSSIGKTALKPGPAINENPEALQQFLVCLLEMAFKNFGSSLHVVAKTKGDDIVLKIVPTAEIVQANNGAFDLSQIKQSAEKLKIVFELEGNFKETAGFKVTVPG